MADATLPPKSAPSRGSRPARAACAARAGCPASSTASAPTRCRSRCRRSSSAASSSSRTGANTLITLQIDGSEPARARPPGPARPGEGHAHARRLRARPRRPDDPGRGAASSLLGEPEGVSQGGMLEQLMHSLTVEGLPGQLPTAIEHDVSALVLGDQLHVSDVAVAGGRRRHQRPRRAHRHDLGAARTRRGRGRSCSRSRAKRAPSGRGRRGRGRSRPRTPLRRSRTRSCCAAERVRRRARERPPTCSWSGSAIPGEEYARTRHNVGAEVVELLARRHGGRLRKSKERAPSSTRCGSAASGSRSRSRPRT